MKKAVILFNLGGPDSAENIKPFLFNFFMDKNIIRLPLPLRFFIARLISIRRSKREAGESYGELGSKSPLLANSQAQAEALEIKLGPGHKVFVCMRYWHPMADEVAAKVRDYGPDEIILLPLYPQFSTTTTRSSFQQWDKAADRNGLVMPAHKICCYPLAAGFIESSAANIRAAMEQARLRGHRSPRILFSAHGLPESVVKDGDPYQWQCEQTAKAIAKKLSLEKNDWQICYQSRVGPQKWIGPSTEEALHKAAADQVPVIVYPHAFTQEHVETLVELDIEYRELAEEIGLHGYYRAQTAGNDENFIQTLAALVENPVCERICPAEYRRCYFEA